jgi:GABA(A) receptor-associated protein
MMIRTLLGKSNNTQVIDKELQNPNKAIRILTKYYDSIPVIIITDIPIDKYRYIVPKIFTFGQFVYFIRKRMDLDTDKALFILTQNNSIPLVHTNMEEMYNKYKDKSGFLILQANLENTFG